MNGYWLNCDECKKDFRFSDFTKYNGISSYLWNEFLGTDFDQSLLTLVCPECKGSLRITYEFPRMEKDTVKVRHIVFITGDEKFYQMLWETFPVDTPVYSMYDFKYMNGNNTTGLNRPVVMS